jgi:PadR family transcriptional regulator PadR
VRGATCARATCDVRRAELAHNTDQHAQAVPTCDLFILIYEIDRYAAPMPLDQLGELEHLILLAIVRLGPDSYGVPIVDELRKHTRRPVLRPSVYLALRRLEDKGLVRSRLGEPEARRGGRARRYFDATPTALKLLRESQRTLTSLWSGLALNKTKG